MKNLINTLLLILVANFTVLSQTTATDFTAIDCHGDSYDLFSKLDAGKIVVLAWVMPCSACISDPLESYTITQNYDVTHPNQIQFNLVDDLGNTSCESLSGWAGLYGMGNVNMISDPVVSMSDYGVDGMPKIVIIAGSNHKIYFNENSSTAGFQEALELALTENPLSINELNSIDYKLSVFPNPTKCSLNVSYSLSIPSVLTIEIVNLLGIKVAGLEYLEKKKNGTYSELVDVSNLSNGIYFLKITSSYGSQIKKFVISR